MYRVALISLSLTSDPHAIKLALAHDIAEAIVGDITPHDGVSKEVKHELERKAMLHICFDVVSGEFGQELWELWNEYELGETECAKLVKDVDKFEMLVQAEEYERMGYKLGEFFDGVEGKLNTDCVKEMDMALRKEREERRSRS